MKNASAYALCFLGATVACSGSVLDAGHTDAGPEPGSDAGAPDDSGPVAVGNGSYSASQVLAASANCSLPHGPAQSPATVGEKRALIVGNWLFCSATGSDLSAYSPQSIAFTADGQWYNLLSDGQGGLMHGFGVDNQGTYYVTDVEDASADMALGRDTNVYIYNAAGGFDGDPISFESSPTRMQILIGSTDVLEWYVRLP